MPASADTFEFSLTAANSPVSVPLGGFFVRCLTAAEDFLVSVDGLPYVPFGVGRSIVNRDPSGAPQRFGRLDFKRASGAAIDPNAIVVVIGTLDYVDDRLNVSGGASLSAQVLATPADVAVTAAANATLLPANAARRCARIRNNGTAAARISSSAADLTAGRGELLNPGEVLETFVKGALLARGAGNTTLIPSEEVF